MIREEVNKKEDGGAPERIEKKKESCALSARLA